MGGNNKNINKEHKLNPQSPCIRNCCLDNSDICLGCFRHIDEIVGWQNLKSQEKEYILKQCQIRAVNKASELDF